MPIGDAQIQLQRGYWWRLEVVMDLPDALSLSGQESLLFSGMAEIIFLAGSSLLEDEVPVIPVCSHVLPVADVYMEFLEVMVFKQPSSESSIDSTSTAQTALYFCIDVGLGGEKDAKVWEMIHVFKGMVVDPYCRRDGGIVGLGLGKASQDSPQSFRRVCCSGIVISIMKLQDGGGRELPLVLVPVKAEQPAIHMVNDLNSLGQVLA
eukprot:g29566.t1